ncbi:hypothetical protein PSV08DRAFT_192085, partial [Bipolaris maydis]|uniref:uncharacterized protein n=1 Tax=Cochliobolus heterostrophus TaxID=5016 RepID=UPI0024DB3D74
LKDNVRKNVGNPGWTDVSTTSQRGIRQAWCNLSIEGKAETAYRYYSKIPGVSVCLMIRTSNGEYLLLYYNCAVSFPAMSQRSHNPCGRQENSQRLMLNRAVLSCNTTVPFVPHHIMQSRGYSFQSLGFYPFYVAGVHLHGSNIGFVSGRLP